MANFIKFINLSVLGIFVGLVFQFGIIKVCGTECGRVDLLDPRISDGIQTHRGEWPFLAALYYIEKLKFFCAGTIISMKHVLTGIQKTCTAVRTTNEQN